MRIHELLAAQIILALLDEIHLVEDELVRLPEMPEAQAAGALEPILLNDSGEVAEGASANVFIGWLMLPCRS